MFWSRHGVYEFVMVKWGWGRGRLRIGDLIMRNSSINKDGKINLKLYDILLI